METVPSSPSFIPETPPPAVESAMDVDVEPYGRPAAAIGGRGEVVENNVNHVHRVEEVHVEVSRRGEVTPRCVESDVHANEAAGVGVKIVSVDEDGDVDENDGMVDVGGTVGLGCLMRSAEGSRREE